MPSACTGATDSLLLGFWRWSFCSRATPYKTSAPGRLMVLIRPPSLEPSTPDVRDPRAWVTVSRLAGRPTWERGEDGGDRGVVAQAPGVEHQVVVRRQGAIVSVDLLDVGGPVLVRQLEPATRLFLGLVLALHDGFHPDRHVRAEEHVHRAGVVVKDIRASAADDDDVFALGRLPDHLLGDLEDGTTGVEHRVGVGRRPGRAGLGRDHGLGVGGSKCEQQTAHQGTRLLVFRLDLLPRQLEPVRDLVDQLGVEEVAVELGRQHVADRPAPGPDLPPDGDDRHSPAPSWLLQVVAELLRARRVAQLTQRLGLDLADALARDAESLADLFERPLVAVDQPET